MKFTLSLLGLGLLACASADVQTVHLTFHGGPAQYSLTIPADGQVYQTNNDISVSIIDAPDYNAISQCTFYTVGDKTLVGGITSEGLQQVLVGPPQPITGVSCYGFCVGIYGDCYDINGQFVGPCCNGYCAADKCRPWVTPF
ncbi:hypothetical protein PFICI_10639 [Pestalotiopsis fici W106-1]|uniref:Uncharacterized protein n=1 Tax=Pestalotiopsis fici (strain W106-1 / CGMCC3.15140) TaxID=1229662 RepID=W3WZK9_PESFW|nr:uncharacterized protein PFICI_10639 [Pestalotiopsis fici W106-1]ETS78577.1 hypothetical protein PFICI_10639 [Pestalotiopsis fici W106-1]